MLVLKSKCYSAHSYRKTVSAAHKRLKIERLYAFPSRSIYNRTAMKRAGACVKHICGRSVRWESLFFFRWRYALRLNLRAFYYTSIHSSIRRASHCGRPISFDLEMLCFNHLTAFLICHLTLVHSILIPRNGQVTESNVALLNVSLAT